MVCAGVLFVYGGRLAAAFSFLAAPANFEVSDTLIRFTSTDSNARAVLAGVLNVVVVGVLASLLGCALAATLTLMRLSGIDPAMAVARAVTDIVRGTPVLLQIVALYFLLLSLPPPREAEPLLGCALMTNRGLFLPSFGFDGISCPQLAGFQVTGGFRVSVEEAALVVGLGLYASAFLAEILRGSLGSIAPGQWDAARSLGLRPLVTFFKVILPQALVASIPPATSVFAGVFKNTALGIAIGYSDLMTISNSIITITSRAAEMMVLVCLAFFVINYSVNGLLNGMHRRLVRRYGR